MATEVDDREHVKEPGIGLALLTVLGMILTIAVLSLLIWALMIGVAATTAGRQPQTTSQPPLEPVIGQKALPAKQP